MDEYRWPTPMEWLLDHIAEAGPAQTKVIAIRLAKVLDADTIQEIYQEEMSKDGYFRESLSWQTCGIMGNDDGKEKRRSMRVVTLGIPDRNLEDFQAALGLTDEELFVLEQAYLRQQAELSALRDQLRAWRASGTDQYHQLWSLSRKLLHAICDHYGLHQKYALQDMALKSDAPDLLKTAWALAYALDLRAMP